MGESIPYRSTLFRFNIYSCFVVEKSYYVGERQDLGCVLGTDLGVALTPGRV